jgi:hypothetical protein
VKLTIHMYLVPRLGMSGVILKLHLYALMVWRRKFHPYFTCCFSIKRVFAAKPLQIKIVIIKLKPALWDKPYL